MSNDTAFANGSDAAEFMEELREEALREQSRTPVIPEAAVDQFQQDPNLSIPPSATTRGGTTQPLALTPSRVDTGMDRPTLLTSHTAPSPEQFKQTPMWDLKCIAAAFCFTVSNILYSIHGIQYMRSSSYSHKDSDDASDTIMHNFTHWKDLDPDYIQNRWKHRESSGPLMMWAGLFGVMAWFWFMIPILQSAWVLSRGGKRAVGLHMLLGSLAVFGSLIELFARLLMVGMTNAAMWLARDFNLDDWTEEGDGTGWRVLEMIHIVTHGMILWVDAFEVLAMFGIVCILFYSVATEPKYKTKSVEGDFDDTSSDMDRIGAELEEFGSSRKLNHNEPPASAFSHTKILIPRTFNKCFLYYGLFIGGLCIIDFIADVLRFVNWMLFGRIAMAINVVVGVILLPIWLLIFAKQLPIATERFERMQHGYEMMDENAHKTSLMGKGVSV